MIADQETNIVFVADTLEREFPAVYAGLTDILGRHEIPLRRIPGTRSIWCRDYMPVQVSEGRFVQFRYAPDYLTGKYRHLRADGEIGPRLPDLKNCQRSEIVLDGGNVVGGTDWVIVCDKVFAENPAIRPPELLRKLAVLLEVERVVVIPTEPGDVVGHADGLVRYVNDELVLVNDYARIDTVFRRALLSALRRGGLDVLEIPYRPDSRSKGGIPSAVGCHLNYLRVGDVLIIPEFGRPEDVAMACLFEPFFPGTEIHGLKSSALAREGGAVHCITWGLSNKADR